MIVAQCCFEFECEFNVGWRQFPTLIPHCNNDILLLRPANLPQRSERWYRCRSQRKHEIYKSAARWHYRRRWRGITVLILCEIDRSKMPYISLWLQPRVSHHCCYHHCCYFCTLARFFSCHYSMLCYFFCVQIIIEKLIVTGGAVQVSDQGRGFAVHFPVIDKKKRTTARTVEN